MTRLLLPNIDVTMERSTDSGTNRVQGIEMTLRSSVKDGDRLRLPRTHECCSRKNGKYSIAFTHLDEDPDTLFDVHLANYKHYRGALIIYGLDQLSWHLQIISQLMSFVAWADAVADERLKDDTLSIQDEKYHIILVRLGENTNDELDQSVMKVIDKLKLLLQKAEAKVYFYKCEWSEEDQLYNIVRNRGYDPILSWIEPTEEKVKKLVEAYTEWFDLKMTAEKITHTNRCLEDPTPENCLSSKE